MSDPVDHHSHCQQKRATPRAVPAKSPVSLPVLKGTGPARTIARSKNGPRRAVVLLLVHVIMAAHLAHWWLTGSTLSPVEPSESMQTLELGLVNAGFVFFAIAILATAIFGRFFCGWGCHIVALQDLCGWLMKKCGVHPRPFRSRLLAFAPLLLAFYMFAWPAAKRVLLAPLLEPWWPNVRTDLGVAPFPDEGFRSHLMTDAFWDTFPEPWLAIPFLLVCGFATVYLLGAKGFCTYGCPYGGLFGPADLISPGKIVVDHDRCHQCGHCTAVCTSNVRVHEEIKAFGSVVDPGCMKCMDCVSVCPNEALSFRFARPSAFKKQVAESRPVRRYDTSPLEDIGLACAGLLAFACWRGAYGLVPMLMAVGLAACLTFLFWKLWRMARDRDVRLGPFQLKRAGRTTRAGALCGAAIVLLWMLTAHTGAVQAMRWQADRAYEELSFTKQALLAPSVPTLPPDRVLLARSGMRWYALASGWADGGWGLVSTDSGDLRAALLGLSIGKIDQSIELLDRVIHRSGPSDELVTDLGRVLRRRGDESAADELYERTLAEHPEFWAVREEQALAALRSGRAEVIDRAVQGAESALQSLPPERFTRLAHARTRLTLARLLGPLGRPEEAVEQLREAVRVAPREPVLRENLAAALLQVQGDLPGAVAEMSAAVDLSPGDLARRFRLATLQLQAGLVEAALAGFAELERRDPGNAPRRAAIVDLLRASGRTAEADRWSQRPLAP